MNTLILLAKVGFVLGTAAGGAAVCWGLHGLGGYGLLALNALTILGYATSALWAKKAANELGILET